MNCRRVTDRVFLLVRRVQIENSLLETPTAFGAKMPYLSVCAVVSDGLWVGFSKSVPRAAGSLGNPPAFLPVYEATLKHRRINCYEDRHVKFEEVVALTRNISSFFIREEGEKQLHKIILTASDRVNNVVGSRLFKMVCFNHCPLRSIYIGGGPEGGLVLAYLLSSSVAFAETLDYIQIHWEPCDLAGFVLAEIVACCPKLKMVELDVNRNQKASVIRLLGSMAKSANHRPYSLSLTVFRVGARFWNRAIASNGTLLFFRSVSRQEIRFSLLRN